MALHALDIALSQLGIREKTGRNDGIPAERYMRGDKLAWCMGLQLYCFDEADDPDVWDAGLGADEGRNSDYWKLRKCSTSFGYLYERGFTLGRNVLPAPNDLIFFFGRGGSDAGGTGGIDHVGIVNWVGARFGDELIHGMQPHSIQTVEGNLSNTVKEAEHLWPNPRIAGFARLCPTPTEYLGRPPL